MSKTTFSIDGLDELIQAFAQLPDDAIHKLSAPSVDAAEKVAERAKSKVRNRTGDLANAITVKKPGKPKNKKAYQIFAKVSFKKEGMHGVPLEVAPYAGAWIEMWSRDDDLYSRGRPLRRGVD